MRNSTSCRPKEETSQEVDEWTALSKQSRWGVWNRAKVHTISRHITTDYFSTLLFPTRGVRTLKTDRLASRDSHWKAEKNARGATFAEYADNGRASVADVPVALAATSRRLSYIHVTARARASS